MKKILIASLMPLLIVSSFSSFAEVLPPPPTGVTVDGGKINFTGAVVAAPCAVDVDNNGQSVMLGQVATNKLSTKGDSSSAVPFSIKLSGCELTSSDATGNYTSATITFSGLTAGDSSTLALTSGSSGEQLAKNVGLQILQNNKPVMVDGSAPTKESSIIAGSNEIPFSAAYVATADKASAGVANSTVSFRVSYK
jgi:type 1 fimbria pilin